MKLDQLPILITVPHGGTEVPNELKNRTALKEQDIFDNSDSMTRELFNFKDKVYAFIDASISRAFIDLNRSPLDKPPVNMDGVIKKLTIFGKQVYKSGNYPDDVLIHSLLNKYFYPYHKKIDGLLNKSKIKLAIDCHSMMPVSHIISIDKNEKRPLICLSNGGDDQGQPLGKNNKTTCSAEILQVMSECFQAVLEINPSDIKMNHPFTGGYTIQSHKNDDIPWIQIQINEKLYVQRSNKGASKFIVSTAKADVLKDNIFRAIQLFFLNI